VQVFLAESDAAQIRARSGPAGTFSHRDALTLAFNCHFAR
jgi:hypothetical protein